MTAEDFCAWLETRGLSDGAAARTLGLGSRNTVARYRREGAPLYIALACAALDAGLPPWQPQHT